MDNANAAEAVRVRAHQFHEFIGRLEDPGERAIIIGYVGDKVEANQENRYANRFKEIIDKLAPEESVIITRYIADRVAAARQRQSFGERAAQGRLNRREIE